jgi:hypothetical protein
MQLFLNQPFTPQGSNVVEQKAVGNQSHMYTVQGNTFQYKVYTAMLTTTSPK